MIKNRIERSNGFPTKKLIGTLDRIIGRIRINLIDLLRIHINKLPNKITKHEMDKTVTPFSWINSLRFPNRCHKIITMNVTEASTSLNLSFMPCNYYIM